MNLLSNKKRRGIELKKAAKSHRSKALLHGRVTARENIFWIKT